MSSRKRKSVPDNYDINESKLIKKSKYRQNAQLE